MMWFYVKYCNIYYLNHTQDRGLLSYTTVFFKLGFTFLLVYFNQSVSLFDIEGDENKAWAPTTLQTIRVRKHVNQFYEKFQFNILDDHDFIVHPESSYQLLYLCILHPSAQKFCTETNQSYNHKIAKCREYWLVCCIFFLVTQCNSSFAFKKNKKNEYFPKQ